MRKCKRKVTKIINVRYSSTKYIYIYIPQCACILLPDHFCALLFKSITMARATDRNRGCVVLFFFTDNNNNHIIRSYYEVSMILHDCVINNIIIIRSLRSSCARTTVFLLSKNLTDMVVGGNGRRRKWKTYL